MQLLLYFMDFFLKKCVCNELVVVCMFLYLNLQSRVLPLWTD